MYLPALLCGVMSDTGIETTPVNSKAEEWAERTAAQRDIGQAVLARNKG
jgi:hypothetical protein